MKLAEFSFELPPELIAQKPAEPRDSCRLMVLDRSAVTIQDKHFCDLEALLHSGDVLVMNNSRVLPARILFEYEGKKVELFLLRKIDSSSWIAIGKPGKILVAGKIFQLEYGLSFEIDEVYPDGQRRVRFSLAERELDEVLEKIGVPPFPPYIKNPEASFDDYQTVYAAEKGSVAAPTAGLHFTRALLDRLQAKGVQLEFVTLHVGLGTFQPVKTEIIEDHQMHSELFFLDEKVAQRLSDAKKEGRRIIAVGTTSVRVLESTYEESSFKAGYGETAIFIYPGYQWKAVNGLITNFHLPQSTLIMLVSAFAGKEFVLRAYNHAIQQKYRFYSFGDAMLLL